MAQTYKRHIAKTITWRIVGTIDTILLSWLVTGNPYTGLKIGFSEVVTKMLLYYLHERIWFRVKAGVTKNGDSRKRHIAKTITWRAIGTLDTMLLAWWISGDPFTGLKIGLIEVITKMILYYLHERAWYKYDFGLQQRRDQELKRKEPLENSHE
ncbi:putative membrane protein [Gramella sp. Hel_I_59]|nr:putative membrane protein [Gramella sp. Hel_I_59]